MKSPFPGMDPYLEAHWSDVHTRLITYTREALQAQIPTNLNVQVEENVALEALSGDELETQRAIRIIDSHSDDRVITAIEVLSRANKETQAGRQAYRRNQQDLLQSEACLVEIDLLRGGEYVLIVPCDVMPLEQAAPMAACVTFGDASRQGSVYRIALRERLPTIRIPLRENDAPARLDLQALVDKAYENGSYGDIDYRANCVPPMTGEDEAWADTLLREQGRR